MNGLQQGCEIVQDDVQVDVPLLLVIHDDGNVEIVRRLLTDVFVVPQSAADDQGAFGGSPRWMNPGSHFSLVGGSNHLPLAA